MKTLITLFFTTFIINNTASANTLQKYSCFTDGYEPGMTVEFSLQADGSLYDYRSYIKMPDSSEANVSFYGSNVNTMQKLEDGKITFTGWDFSKAPVDEATLIIEKDFKSGVIIIRSGNEQLPLIQSVSCSKM